jgi:hypothetical protein
MFLAMAMPVGAADQPPPGDRYPDTHCVYPTCLFLHTGEGGQILDVTQPPFNAKGDGRTDDTAALVAAYDYALGLMDKTSWSAAGPEYSAAPIIYLPKGTYLVSDTIVYSGPERAGWNLVPVEQQQALGRKGTGTWDGDAKGVPRVDFARFPKGTSPWERVCRIRFIGESRKGTVIRLEDNSPQFRQAGTNGKPVLCFGKSHFNNRVAMNAVRHLTVDTGHGNPAAVGIDWVGANACDITDVTVRSGDGRGIAGVLVRMAPTQGYHHDLTIEGFDYGIRLDAFHVTHPVFEYVTLRNQRKAGVYVGDSSTSLRKIRSTNSVPAVVGGGSASHIVLLDSLLTGGSEGVAAIDIRKGTAFLRDVAADGYAVSVRHAGGAIEEAEIRETVVGQTFSFPKGTPARSLRLPIAELPIMPWEEDLSQWANVRDYGAVADGTADDSKAIQMAMDSGKSTIYFPASGHHVGNRIRVPATVKRIVGLFHRNAVSFVVSEASADPLVIEDGVLLKVIQAEDRPVVMNGLIFTESKAEGTGFTPTLFANNCSATAFKRTSGYRIWCRFANPEGKAIPLISRDGCRMWVLGYKTERGGQHGNVDFLCAAGGSLEVLGGVTGVHPEAILQNEGGSVSITCATSSNSSFLKNPAALIREVRGETTVAEISSEQLPDRRCDTPQVCTRARPRENTAVPLYVSDPQQGVPLPPVQEGR